VVGVYKSAYVGDQGNIYETQLRFEGRATLGLVVLGVVMVVQRVASKRGGMRKVLVWQESCVLFLSCIWFCMVLVWRSLACLSLRAFSSAS